MRYWAPVAALVVVALGIGALGAPFAMVPLMGEPGRVGAWPLLVFAGAAVELAWTGWSAMRWARARRTPPLRGWLATLALCAAPLLFSPMEKWLKASPVAFEWEIAAYPALVVCMAEVARWLLRARSRGAGL